MTFFFYSGKNYIKVLLFSYLVFNGIFVENAAQYYPISQFTIYEGLSDNQANALICDDLGNIWVSSPQNGVTCLNGNDIQIIDKQNGLCDNRILDIEVSENAVWFATENGLSKRIGKEFHNFLTSPQMDVSIPAIISDIEIKNIFLLL